MKCPERMARYGGEIAEHVYRAACGDGVHRHADEWTTADGRFGLRVGRLPDGGWSVQLGSIEGRAWLYTLEGWRIDGDAALALVPAPITDREVIAMGLAAERVCTWADLIGLVVGGVADPASDDGAAWPFPSWLVDPSRSADAGRPPR